MRIRQAAAALGASTVILAALGAAPAWAAGAGTETGTGTGSTTPAQSLSNGTLSNGTVGKGTVSYGTVSRSAVFDLAALPASTSVRHPRLTTVDATTSTATGTSSLAIAVPDTTAPLLTGATVPVMSVDQQIQDFGSGQNVEPPDTQLAAGPTNLVEAVNMTLSIWTKAGSLVADKDLNVVFGVPAGYSFSDPHVQWDSSSSRWFMSGMSFDANCDGQVYVAVSATADPTGVWTVYTVASDTSGVLLDQPKLGYSDDKVAVSWDDFTNNGSSWAGSETKVLQKSDLLSGAASPAVAEWKPTADANQWSVVPVQSLSPTTTQYLAYLWADGTATPSLNVLAVTGTPAKQNVSFSETDLPVAATNIPPAANQPGQSASIDTGDDRLESAVWQNGTLWTGANDTCQPTGDTSQHACLRLDQVTTGGSAPTLRQDFDAGVPGEDLYYPAVSMDASGDMVVGFSDSSTTAYGSAAASGQRVGAPLDTLSALVTVQAGSALYDVNGCGGRWGDYSGAAVDPAQPGTVWVTDEYAEAGSAADQTTGCGWATATAPVSFAPTASAMSPNSGPLAGGTVVTITGTDLNGASAVDFGTGNPAGQAPVVSADGTSLTVTAPAATTAGAVTVTVATPSGPVDAGQFTYQAPTSGGGTTTTSGGTTTTSGGTTTTSGGTTTTSGGTTTTSGGTTTTSGGGTTTTSGGGTTTGGGSTGGGGGGSTGGGGGGGGGSSPTGTLFPVSGSSTDASGSATATSTDPATSTSVRAAASGQGTVTVAQYASDPAGTPDFQATGVYVDVKAASGSTFRSLTAQVCGLAGGNALQWWDPSAGGGSGAWTPVSDETYQAGSPACVSFSVDGTTSPNLGQMGGTILAVAKVAAGAQRIAGADREATAVAISQASFPNGGAGAVVLARADDYPDALAGSALAAAQDAPVLLTSGQQLDAATSQELTRVLTPGGTVYLLGGTSALSDQVAAAAAALGYQTVRYGGSDRFATATAIDNAVGPVTTILLADGDSFADALSASAATGTPGTVVALTSGRSLPAATSALLAANPGAAIYAIGGPAAAADPSARAIVGSDRYQTSSLVAARLFAAPSEAGIATGLNFPDALAAGPWLARMHAPLLLSQPNGLPTSVQSYLTGVAGTLTQVELYGGESALGSGVAAAVQHAVGD